ncbi:hypothetical protein [Cryobacterium arcticum]|jgi:hypothetical protein|uniref:Uncharacterized protein n=1 Tax=Cryobacterium arcticum TaxID=670052 RepID=A0A1B1BEK3_9MICO|nr:hypothetical protein [Cryobacterium arcticum]ANP71005.1 hypothetical protein PA27867_0026 [Cryobacterium arcticum]
MNSDQTNDQKTPDGSTNISEAEKARLDALPDGSQTDGDSETEEDVASGSPEQ